MQGLVFQQQTIFSTLVVQKLSITKQTSLPLPHTDTKCAIQWLYISKHNNYYEFSFKLQWFCKRTCTRAVKQSRTCGYTLPSGLQVYSILLHSLWLAAPWTHNVMALHENLGVPQGLPGGILLVWKYVYIAILIIIWTWRAVATYSIMSLASWISGEKYIVEHYWSTTEVI